MSKKPPPVVTATFAIKDHGEVCPRRGIPLVDVYLTGAGGKADIGVGCWMSKGGVSLPFAESMAEWFKAAGATVERCELSSQPEHGRNLFTEVV